MKLPPLPSFATIALGVSATFVAGHTALAQSTGFNQTGAGPFDYNTASNWIGGAINGVWGPDLTLAENQAVTFSTSQTLAATNGIALNFSHAGAFSTTLRSDGNGAQTITLGGDVLVNTASTSPSPIVFLGSFTANQNLSINLGGASRTFNVTSSGARNISVRGNLVGTHASDGVVKIGAGTLTYEAIMGYTGETKVNGGTLALAGSGAVPSSAVSVANGATLNINNSGNGNTTRVRAQSVAINSGTLSIGSHTGSLAAYDDQISGAISVAGGGTITINTPSNKHNQLTAGSFVQAPGGATLFRGLNLGVNTAASKTANSSNIVFTSAPALFGNGAAGTSSVGIIAGAYGDTIAGGSGTGLVTYDATRGVRLLAGSEYSTTLAHNEGNVSLVGVAGGVSGAPRAVTLDGAATIQSLSLNTSGAAGNSGLVVSGTDALTISSGTIFANQAVTGTVTASDAIVVSKNIHFGGVEGKVLVGNTTGVSNNITAAPLNLSGVISGSAGLTKAGGGNLHLTGTASNTYTGITTFNAGNVLLAKTGGAQAITGDLVLNGGTLVQNANQIADGANVTVNGATWRLAPSGSGGTASSETVASITINSGTVQQSSSSVTSGQLTVTQALTLNGGTYSQVGGYKAAVGSLALNGGTSTVSAANGTTTTVLTVNGDLAITNVASLIAQNGAGYTPITLNAGSGSAAGAQLVLLGDLSFVGNATNAHTTTIATTVNANLGTIQLGGAREFDIGDGAAANDLTINAVLADRSFGATTVGGLLKTGTGTLALGGANTYTGATTINAGTLALVGSGASLHSASALSVAPGARLDASALAAWSLSADSGTMIGVGASVAGLVKAASLNFNGASLTFDFGSVSTLAESYQIFDFVGLAGSGVGGVAATGTTFSGTFAHEGAGVWSLVSGEYSLTFTESTGLLTTASVIPEPSAVAFLAGLAGLGHVVFRRRRRAS